jgi:hypothetical protein
LAATPPLAVNLFAHPTGDFPLEKLAAPVGRIRNRQDSKIAKEREDYSLNPHFHSVPDDISDLFLFFPWRLGGQTSLEPIFAVISPLCRTLSRSGLTGQPRSAMVLGDERNDFGD